MRNRIIFTFFTGLMLIINTGLHAQDSTMLGYIEGRGYKPQLKISRLEALLQKAVALKDQYPDSAFNLFYSVYKESELLDFPDGMASGALWMGAICVSYRGDLPKAQAYFRKAYPYCLRSVNIKKELLFLWHNNMAAAFSMQNKYDSAIAHYYDALTIVTKPDWKAKKDLVMVYNNIAETYGHMQQYEKVEPYLKKAASISRQGAEMKEGLTTTYFNYASLFITRGQLDSAEHYLDRIKKLYTKADNDVNERLNRLYGTIAIQQQLPGKAIAYFKEALATGGNNKQMTRVSNLSGLGTAYALGKDYKQGIHYLQMALRESEQIQGSLSSRNRLDVYENLSELYDYLGNYKKAYRYKDLAGSLKDSLNDVKNIQGLEELENRYKNIQKDKELTERKMQLLLSQASLRKKNSWIAGISTAALILLLSSIMVLRLQVQKAKTAKQQVEIQQLKAVLEGEEKERSRIGRQLHDDIMVELSIVKMSLEALPGQVPGIKGIKDYQNLIKQMEHTGRKLRGTAHNLMPDALLEDGLLSAILYFCRNVEQMTTLSVSFQHYGSVPPFSLDIEVSIYRIIQELVQNIIKHAAATNALVQLDYGENILSITVEDDGIGIQSENGMAEHKMGLQSIRSRLKTLNGTMGIHPCIPHGTSVNIDLHIP